MIVDGRYRFFPKRVACRNAWCSVCSAPRLAIGTRHLAVYHLFFVPLLPLGRKVEWRCRTCHLQVDFLQPVRGWIAGFGIWVGLGMILIGRGEPTITGVGLAMVGLFAWLRHRRRRYEAGVNQVVPLAGDACPLCAGRLAPAARPYCEACEVDVLTR